VVTIILYVARLAVPWLTQEVLDHLSGHQKVGLNIWTLVSLMAITGAMRICAWLIRVEASANFQTRISSNLVYNIFFHHFISSPELKKIPKSGQMLTVFKQETKVITDFILLLIGLIGNSIYGLIALITMAKINLPLTACICLPISMVILLVSLYKKNIIAVRNSARHATDRYSLFILDSFSCISTLKANKREKYVIERFNSLNDSRRTSDLKDNALNRYLNTTYYSIHTLAIGAILFLSSQTSIANGFTVGNLSLFIPYLIGIRLLVIAIGDFSSASKRTKLAIGRMDDVLNELGYDKLTKKNDELFSERTLENKKNNTDVFSKLEVKNLSYQYPDSKVGIFDICFDIKKGEIVVITGLLGSGKSTLLKVLFGELPKRTGQIILNDTTVPSLQGRSSIFFLTQNASVFSYTLEENIKLGNQISQERFQNTINTASLDRDIGNMDSGFQTELGVKGFKLSGGQRKRVALARALASNSDLFVIDDLESTLDFETEKEIWNNLRTFINNDKALLVVSNSQFIIDIADKVIVLNEGKITADIT
jgi:ATP-binding cassette subfamily B protein